MAMALCTEIPHVVVTKNVSLSKSNEPMEFTVKYVKVKTIEITNQAK